MLDKLSHKHRQKDLNLHQRLTYQTVVLRSIKNAHSFPGLKCGGTCYQINKSAENKRIFN